MFNGTISSNGFQTTSTTNQVVEFFDPHNNSDTVTSRQLQLETGSSAISFFINGEYDIAGGTGTLHKLEANSFIVFEDINIDKITILENAVEYKFVGLF